MEFPVWIPLIAACFFLPSVATTGVALVVIDASIVGFFFSSLSLSLSLSNESSSMNESVSYDNTAKSVEVK
ncbi:MAG: hypothetical protein ACI8RD_001401 [Bacillariaceae sp.]|jgi:hypothetical protein